MSARLLLSLLFAALCSESNAYSHFKTRIPNGDKVPNPCNRSTIWQGVGHENSGGAGPRNLFGMDLKANNNTWNRTLCEKDSDGDGLSNGQELGDPNCTWTEGKTPTYSTNISHPGICEPLGSPRCSGKNSWLMDCRPGKFNCPAINRSGVRNYTMRFPVTPVPTEETIYICHRFTLPNDSVSDIIAIEPVVNNTHVLHHMLLYGCTDEPKDKPANEPFQCGMGSGLTFCMSLIGIWGVGMTGQCLNSQLGFRMGPDGFKYAIIQLHWNNPEHKMNLMDSSGMKIYHTTELRPNRGQIAMMGQTYLEIPPGQKEVTFTGTCVSGCTKKLPHSIFLTSATLHMHTLGKSGDIRLNRNGNLLQMLDNVTQYDYNTPTLTEFDNPIELNPGDEIQVKCVFQSSQRNSTTYYGEATSDEMCLGFFAYYPLLKGFDFCGQWKSISTCNSNGDSHFEACDFSTLRKLISLLPYTCAESCTSTACAVILDGMHDTGCHNYPDVKQFIHVFMHNNSKVFEKCSMERPPKTTTKPQCPVNHSPGQGVSLGFSLVLILIAYAAY